MFFNSYTFALFCPAVLLLYWMISHRGQNILLVGASYLFYAAWNPRFLLLMWLTTGVDYLVGLRLNAIVDDTTRRRILAVSVSINLLILGVFKYYNFFAESAATLMQSFGLSTSPPLLKILLPVGISFYTFHGISYTVDVYRNHVKAVRDPIAFAAFVSYFPQLVAGPIGRAEIQLPQFEHPRARPSRDQMMSSVTKILVGFAKKVIIADSLAPYVNQAFGNVHQQNSINLLFAAYAFSLQIYGDFSGYTDIGRGVSELFGISLLENFRQPYLAASITEFWQRWHISLSSWLRDYLYVPLGGNRGSRSATYRNLFLTMLIGGLWHGAAWTFVVWGALHGLLLTVERARSDDRLRRGATSRLDRSGWRRIGATVMTFHVVTAAWVIFRSETLSDAWAYFVGLSHISFGALKWSLVILLAISGSLVMVFDLGQAVSRTEDSLRRWPRISRGLLLGGLVVLFIVVSGGAREPFIYFRF